MPLTTAEALNILREAELPCFSETWPETVHAANGFGETPLHVVAVWGRIDLAEALLAGGAEINRPGEHRYTALHEAVSQGKVEMVRWLLDHGADPHLVNESSLNAWQLAIMLHPQVEMAAALLAGGAEINRPGGDDFTALHTAVMCGRVEMVRWLLAHGADHHLTTELGTTWELASYNENSAALLDVLGSFANPKSAI